jgi:hypothetical protein
VDKLDKLQETVNFIAIDVAVMRRDVSLKTKDLAHHIKRTDELQSHVANAQEQLKQLLSIVKWCKNILAAAVVTAVTALVSKWVG